MIKWWVIIVIICIYVIYISPGINLMKAMKHDENLSNHMNVLENVKRFDERSFNKCKNHLNQFLENYGKTYLYDEQNRYMRRMLFHKYKCVGYMNRIPFRMDNDPVMKENVQQSIKTIESIMENYTVESANRKQVNYMPSQV